MSSTSVQSKKRRYPRLTGLERWASRALVSGARQRCILAALWSVEELNRRSLHNLTGIRPNTVGLDIASLLKCGIIKEHPTTTGMRGRPGVAIEIDTVRRNVVGLAMEPGRLSIARMNLVGQVLKSRQETFDRERPDIRMAAQLLQDTINAETLSVGVSITGSVDPVSRSSLYGSTWPKSKMVNLQPLYEIAGKRPLVLNNDMHATAARWTLTRKSVQREDVLLVHFRDGQMGASLLVEGHPNRGCIAGANELGHTRLMVETEPCHCGQSGCLERICSTEFLSRVSDQPGDLMQRAAAYSGTDAAMTRMIDLLAVGISNAVNLLRVHRLVLISEMMRYPQFAQALVKSIHRQMIPDIAQHVQVELWQQVASQAAETAGWLGLANLFLDGWGPAVDLTELGDSETN